MSIEDVVNEKVKSTLETWERMLSGFWHDSHISVIIENLRRIKDGYMYKLKIRDSLERRTEVYDDCFVSDDELKDIMSTLGVRHD